MSPIVDPSTNAPTGGKVTTSGTTPRILQGVPSDAPRYLHVPAFDVQIPADVDPDALDAFDVALRVEVTRGGANYKLHEIKRKDADGRKVGTGRYYRGTPSWLYESQLRPGTPRVTGYTPNPQGVLFAAPDEEEVG